MGASFALVTSFVHSTQHSPSLIAHSGLTLTYPTQVIKIALKETLAFL